MTGWRVHTEVGADQSVHVWPNGADEIEHDLNGAACVCGPALEEAVNGRVLVTHHSLDGRELTEPDRRLP